MVVRVPEAVKGGSLELWVAKLLALVQLERLPAVAERLPVIAEHGMEPANRVQGDSLARPVTGGGGQLQRLPGMLQRLVVQALKLNHDGQGVLDVGLADAVPEFLVDAQGVPQLRPGGRVVAEPGVRVAELPVSEGPRGRVAQLLRGG